MRLSYVIVVVSDMARALSFYRDVLGLPVRFESPGWTELVTGAATLALHLGAPAPGGCRPGLAVADLDAFHRRMVEHGVPCLETPNMSFGARIARYADPDGTEISVGEERPGSPVVHWQIVSRDPERAAGFYREVLGWRVAAADALGQRAVDTGSRRGVAGGIWPGPPDGHAFAQLFAAVVDVEATVRAVQAHGGRVIVPAQRLPDGSQVAIVADAEGIPFGLTTG